MATLTMTPRIRVALLFVVVGCAWVQAAPNCPEDPCTDPEHDIGEAYEETAPVGGRKMLQTRAAAPVNVAPNLANRRSLLAPMCSETQNTIDAVISCTNAVRMSPGSFSADYRCGSSWVGQYQALGALSKDSKLTVAAQRHSEDNGRMGYLSHTGSDGSSVSNRVQNAGYAWGSVRENIAFGYTSAKDVVMGWMCSSGHRKNIMSCDIKDIGVGIAQGRNGRHYHTQVFACPRGTRCSCAGAGPSAGESPSFTEPSEPSSGGFEEPHSPTPKPTEGPFGGHTPEEKPKEEPFGESPHGKPSGSFNDFFNSPYFRYKQRRGGEGEGGNPFGGSNEGGAEGDHMGGESGPVSGESPAKIYRSSDGRVFVKRSDGEDGGSSYSSVSVYAGAGGDSNTPRWFGQG